MSLKFSFVKYSASAWTIIRTGFRSHVNFPFNFNSSICHAVILVVASWDKWHGEDMWHFEQFTQCHGIKDA